MNKYKWLLLTAVLLLLVPILAGCSASDPLTESFYATSIYTWNGTAFEQVIAGGGGTGNVTSFNGRTGVVLPLVGDYSTFYEPIIVAGLITDYWRGDKSWQPFPAETDPVFSGFNIGSTNITAWNALVSSQWIADVNGINYIGNVGIHTTSSATGLLSLYSSDGISNDPILSVMDNSASDESVGIRVNMAGVKTDYTDGLYITNICTTATAGADKYGLRIKNSGNWLGVGSTNYALYIETPIGGTANYSIYSEGAANYLGGTLTLGDVLDMGTHQIENVVDPNDAQDAATKNYVDTHSGATTFLALIDTPVTYVGQANKVAAVNPAENAIEFTDPIPKATNWSGNFNWVTASYTTNETDISSLFSTNLTGTTRRKYSVYLDLTNVYSDASLVSLYLSVQTKVDGTNYRAIDRKIVLKADIAPLAEPGIIIMIPSVAQDTKVTMQMTTALAGDATIYYSVVKEHLE